MCGIVGLYLKNSELQAQLGSMFQPMLVEMSSRGPDSAGVAIYRNPVESGQTKFSLAHDNPDFCGGYCGLKASRCEQDKGLLRLQRDGNRQW